MLFTAPVGRLSCSRLQILRPLLTVPRETTRRFCVSAPCPCHGPVACQEPNNFSSEARRDLLFVPPLSVIIYHHSSSLPESLLRQ